MYNIALFSTLGVPVLAILYSFILSRSVSQKPSGSKKMADVSKVLSEELKSGQAKNIKDFALVAIVLFTGLMYAFGWQPAVSFLAGAVVFVLVDYYLMNLSAKTSIRLAEAAKSGVVEAYKFNYNFSAAGTFLTAGSGFLLVSVGYFVFKDPTTLLALALSAILVSIFSWRSGRHSYFGSYVAVLAVVVALAEKNLSNYQYANIFPLVFAAFILFAMAIGGLFFRLSSKTLNITAAYYRALAVVSVLFLAGAYFGSKYILADTSKFGTIKLAIILAVGLVLALVVILVRQFSKILPTLAVASAILVANFLAGVYGVSLVAIGFLALWPLSLITNLFIYQAKNAAVIAVSAEMSSETVVSIKVLEDIRIKTSGYFVSLFGIAALSLLFFYFLEFGSLKFLATDSKLLSGLLFGAVLSYLLSSELMNNKILKIAVTVLAAIVAGLTLGPIFLAGVMSGAILIDLLVSQAVSSEVLALTITGILSASFIEIQYSLMIRGIIAAGVLIIVTGYFVIKKVFDGRKTKIAK